MEEKDFEAKLAKLAYEIEQLDAKIDDKISSLRQELKIYVLRLYVAEVKDVAQSWVNFVRVGNPPLRKPAKRAFGEINKVTSRYLDLLTKVPIDDFETRNLAEYRENINRITRSAGLEELWMIEGKDFKG